MKNPLESLITQLSRLPGIGPKSAQRLAFFLLKLPLSDVQKIASTMADTRKSIQYCSDCFNICIETQCSICLSTTRDHNQLCIVAEPRDLFAIESAGVYNGRYHVLGGLISPLDGVHPEMLRIKELLNRFNTQTYTEVLIALNPTIEGDATTHYLTHICRSFSFSITKLAFGLPIGADLEYADALTLEKAVLGRQKISNE